MSNFSGLFTQILLYLQNVPILVVIYTFEVVRSLSFDALLSLYPEHFMHKGRALLTEFSQSNWLFEFISKQRRDKVASL